MTTITGSGGNDTLKASSSDLLVLGLEGNDTVEVNLSRDISNLTVDGGAGFDTLFLLDADPITSPALGPNLWVNLATGEIRAKRPDGTHLSTTFNLSGIEALYSGTGWRATLMGDAGDNRLESVNDSLSKSVLIGGKGNDTLVGGTADYSQTLGPVTASLLTHVAISVDGTDTLMVDNLVGSAFNDVLVGASNMVDGVVDGGPGDDTITGGSPYATLIGGPGDDLLIGGPGGISTADYRAASSAIQVNMLTGDVQGLATGHDQLVRVDRVQGTPFADTFMGGASTDWFRGAGGADTAIGGDGDDDLADAVLIDGGNGNDRLRANERVDGRATTLLGGSGNDLLVGGWQVSGGAGNDYLVLFRPTPPGVDANSNDNTQRFGSHQLDGGEGFDTISLYSDPVWLGVGFRDRVTINLATGEYRVNDGLSSFLIITSIEALSDSFSWIATFYGDDKDNVLSGSTVFGAAGNDTFFWRGFGQFMDGGAGVDTMRTLTFQPRDAFTLQVSDANTDNNSVVLNNNQGGPSSTAVSVERFVFSDQALATGPRATEVAKIMFPLWSPAIINLAACMGKGVDWYDHGHTFDEGVRYALSFFADKSDAQLAQQLVANVPYSAGGYTATSLLELMTSHSGGAGNIEGRAYAASLMANDAANLANIVATGVSTQGIVCALNWGTEPLFVSPG